MISTCSDLFWESGFFLLLFFCLLGWFTDVFEGKENYPDQTEQLIFCFHFEILSSVMP